jgi:hypothetical protein
MTKTEFYRDKRVAEVEWWLHDCDLPGSLTWARLRVFDDGSADATFGPREKLHGFENRDYASYILSEDEFVCFNLMDTEDEREYGVRLAGIKPPHWEEDPDQPFEYLGTY